MKVKEVDVTANMAWSPGPVVPIMMAAGTAAQQLDATFSTSSTLEIYELNLSEGGHDMPKVSSLGVDNRYHKVVWGEAGIQTGDRTKGVIVGGLDRGFISIYDADRLIKGHESPLIFSKEKHTGPVTALDFNPFQSNLLASGASESEIFIWDLNRLQTPMTPGAKSQPIDDVRCVAWNRQVQHILASTFSSRCVVWDLRKNEPIIKVSDSTSRMRCKVVAWNPDVATQLCLASEDDQTPIIQIWDLRLASSPLRTLEHHQRGILSLAWCQQDSDLLLSCGKDNRILCWNPNTNNPGGEVLCELATSSQWSFEVAWCPRNPAVLASSSFDGKISVFSLMGGTQQVQPSSAIADSFPGMENLQPPVQSTYQSTPKTSVQLKKPPKWLRRPCGANFGFGGKLVTFVSTPQQAQPQPPTQEVQGTFSTSSVYVSGVITEPDLVHRSMRLETSLETRNVGDFCHLKLQETSDKDKEVWNFIEANFHEDPRKKFLNLLGYDPDKVSNAITSLTGAQPANAMRRGSGDEVELSEGISKLTTNGNSNNNGGHNFDDFEVIAAKAEEESERQKPFSICVDESGPGLLSKALLIGNLNLAVDLCLEQNRFADALILAMQGGPELLQDTQKRYFNKFSDSKESHLIRAVVCRDWRSVVERCNLENWREALAAALTHAALEELPSLCAYLGQRLISQAKDKLGQEALLCFVCAGNLDKVVECWIQTRDTSSGPKALQDLVEVVMSLKFAIEQNQGFPVEIGTGPLSEKLSQYASLLASQGALVAAATYLVGQSNDESMVALRDRLAGALDKSETKAAPAQASRGRAVAQPKAPAAKNQYSRDPIASRPSWGQTAYTNPTTPAYNNNPMVVQPVVAPMDFAPHSQVSSYQYGIHNPTVDDLNTYNPPVPHYDHGGITQRRNSRPTASGAYQPGGDMYSSGRKFSGDPVSPQAPVNIFTPNYSQAAAQQDLMTHPALSRTRTMSQSSQRSGTGEPSYVPPTSSGPGWNDPPPMSLVNTKPKGVPKTISALPSGSEPITQPLFGAPVPSMPDPNLMMMQPSHQPMMPSHQPMMQPMAPMQQSMYQPSQSQSFYGQGSYNPPQAGGGYTPAPLAPPSTAAAAPPPSPRTETPEPARPKGPIPPEHKVLQDVFEGLRSKCLSAANHPQTRRKLEDVGKKLEVLYDKLRDNSLPVATTNGLHDVVQYIWAYDYNSCLTVIQQLISSGSFDLLAEFMPGVKVLIQVATQLGTYLERPRQ